MLRDNSLIHHSILLLSHNMHLFKAWQQQTNHHHFSLLVHLNFIPLSSPIILSEECNSSNLKTASIKRARINYNNFSQIFSLSAQQHQYKATQQSKINSSHVNLFLLRTPSSSIRKASINSNIINKSMLSFH
jgi:hypothetical protein